MIEFHFTVQADTFAEALDLAEVKLNKATGDTVEHFFIAELIGTEDGDTCSWKGRAVLVEASPVAAQEAGAGAPEEGIKTQGVNVSFMQGSSGVNPAVRHILAKGTSSTD